MEKLTELQGKALLGLLNRAKYNLDKSTEFLKAGNLKESYRLAANCRGMLDLAVFVENMSQDTLEEYADWA